mmetsp:Transcript_1954/g.2603  ORF Transcript_1954/g.2603 Transcript_1954/m.2603 type:complete len:111 (+) Transcript_1954:98-430(+)|eukprot:CAMPEP_0197316132 /NCGR_PEP_ID=MMETSP0891-20130614/41152_1 /TAXON_ID=44058 ORGANISM="Aureoumbra lagunensis, Strain CCMP1510" /NCGR_SAMPLE_ID=MMETSP0891 /ASSEMBLY_ACC=CAM_ASM_000534 /LENGTH=110 /DNA_ID=CAMNT_0042805453 /DNA_START=124 /DNA_END=456 /DNA_ORIENTATION=-
MQSLLRTILREHRKLPLELRRLGNAYIVKEFRAMQKVTDIQQIEQFQNAWKAYLDQIRAQSSDQQYGQDLDAKLLDQLSDDQRLKLLDMRASSLPSDVNNQNTSSSEKSR